MSQEQKKQIAARLKNRLEKTYILTFNKEESIYKEFGYYQEHLVAMVKKGKQGAQEITTMMKSLRESPYETIAGSPVVRIEDYKTGVVKMPLDDHSEILSIPESNVLIFHTADGSKIAARPSGTEPKIKFYMSVNVPGDTENAGELLQQKIDNILEHLNIA